MSLDLELRTPRLILRQWREEDLAPFAAINADARVMEFLHKSLTREESDLLVSRFRERFAARGFGLLAVERRDAGQFIGFVGLSVPRFAVHFMPCVEVGWRLAFEHWGQGFATEGARAALEFGFEQVGLEEIMSFTSPLNLRSRRVMEKLGMTHDPAEDFDHPELTTGHGLRRHVLYRLPRGAFRDGSGGPRTA